MWSKTSLKLKGIQDVHMENCKPNKTPMATNAHLNLDVEGKPVDQSLYHLTASRADFIFSVCLCAQILFYEAISFEL
jgi:hypothetical protein